MTGTYIIWSSEHGMWWRGNGQGYTPIYSEAGRYPRREALKICRRAHDGWKSGKPGEMPIRLEDADHCMFGDADGAMNNGR